MVEIPWFYVDDGFSDSKPVLNMPARHRLAACGLWVLAGSWSAKEETDGRVPEAKLRQLGARPALVDALTNESEFGTPLWSRVGREVQFNSWAKWQQTHAELVKKRADAAERQRESRSRKLKGRNYVASANDEMSQCDSRVTHDVTETPVTHDVTRDPHARARGPDPTRPDPLSNGHFEGGTHVSSGDRENNPPPTTCDQHNNHPNPPPCHACRLARQAREAWDTEQAREHRQAEDRQRINTQAAINRCRICDPLGQITMPDALADSVHVIKCPHDADEINRMKTEALALRAQIVNGEI